MKKYKKRFTGLALGLFTVTMPLTVIMAGESLLRSDPGKTVGELLPTLDSISSASKSMYEIIERMLELSRADAASASVERSVLDLSFLADKAFLQLEPLAYDKPVSYRSEIAPAVRAIGNEDYFLRTAMGLIQHAIKYEPSDGEVFVSLRAHRKTAVLTVRNQKSVIPEKDLPHIFERFYRGDTSRADNASFGLGLSIAETMVRSMGGSIAADSSPEEGTRFTVCLPLG